MTFLFASSGRSGLKNKEAGSYRLHFFLNLSLFLYLRLDTLLLLGTVRLPGLLEP